MLAQLTISNFTIVRELDIDFQQGMTAITGETGAGKSIAIDALGVCLGRRAEADMVRQGANRAEICARFSLKDTPSAQHWLSENQLDEGHECLLRRVINSDGRSRGFINGTAVPLSQLRDLGQLLIQIHGQHAHQLLLKSGYQKQLLDAYASEPMLTQAMAEAWQQWRQSCRDLEHYQQRLRDRESRRELLHYQLKELNDFAPLVAEYEQIDDEYKQLANSGQLLSLSQQALQLMAESEEHTLQNQLCRVCQLINELVATDNRLNSVLNMLEDAAIQLNEATDELRHYCDHLNSDPDRLQQLEQRISHYISLSRKHRVAPTELHMLHQQLLAEQQTLDQQKQEQSELSATVAIHHQTAQSCAEALHRSRVSYAAELSALMTDSLQQLSMAHGKLVIAVSYQPDNLTSEGADRIDFLICTNPGQPLQPLAKVASGGELSRIALAIQVIAARKMDTPAMIFDEVDVGISGPTAAVVGKMLRQLGETTQVMCVTHLPQVAGCGHAHFFVSKESDGAMTETHMQPLNKKARFQELARLLGGGEVTRNTLANARELLAA